MQSIKIENANEGNLKNSFLRNTQEPACGIYRSFRFREINNTH